MRRPLRRLLLAVAGPAVAVVVAVVVIQTGSHHPSAIEKTARTRAAQAREVARRAGLPVEVQDLLARAAGAVGHRFTVTYRTGDGTTATLIQLPPSKRVDEASGTGADQIVRTLIVNGDGSFSCARRVGRWSCERATDAPVTVGAFTPDEIKATVERLSSQRDAYRFDVTHRRVAGAEATCLVSSPRHPQPNAPTGTLCISNEGAPLLVDGAAGRVEATAYKPSARAAALELPAPVR
ncbi:MAG: hypothetical protein QOG03_824 [Actinomycetota bacterium]|jgi:hypothetical protein|nr:hypothetical protein [Actinomycetota bacterium]